MNAFRLALSCSVIMPGLVWTVFDARAQTCAQAPSCSQLGYTKAVAECTGKTTLLCPFDSSKAFCADDTTCATLGFTDTISECPALMSNALPMLLKENVILRLLREI